MADRRIIICAMAFDTTAPQFHRRPNHVTNTLLLFIPVSTSSSSISSSLRFIGSKYACEPLGLVRRVSQGLKAGALLVSRPPSSVPLSASLNTSRSQISCLAYLLLLFVGKSCAHPHYTTRGDSNGSPPCFAQIVSTSIILAENLVLNYV
jgi:hypothetical protein